MIRQTRFRGSGPRWLYAKRAFTLIEILVTLLILTVLAGVALPNIRDTLKDQKSTQTLRQVKTFFSEAKDRAVATGSYVGVIIDRQGIAGDYGRSSSIQLRLSNGSPPYAGETEQSIAFLFNDDGTTTAPSFTSVGITNAASFLAVDNPLLDISARSYGLGNVPIRIGDRLELQGGRSVRITKMRVHPPITAMTPTPVGVIVNFDPRELVVTRNAQGTYTSNTYAFPGSPKFSNGVASPTRFRIHRAPVPSSVGVFELMKGTTIDLNYSGIGSSGTQFSPFAIDSTNAALTTDYDFQPIIVLFAPDGSVASVSYGLATTSGIVPYSEIPTGNIYLCVGLTDGVRPDNLFDNGKSKANIMDPTSNWVVINPASGRISASPFASVTAPATSTPIATALTQTALQARQYALNSDTRDNI